MYHGCDRENSEQATSSCHLTQTLLVPEFGRAPSCAPFVNGGNARPQNPWQNFRPVGSGHVGCLNEPSGLMHGCKSDAEDGLTECEQEIRNETYPMTRRYIIRNIVTSSSPASHFTARGFVPTTRRSVEGDSEQFQPVVPRPYAFPSVMPKSMQMLSRNMHFVNNYGMKNFATVSGLDFKQKIHQCLQKSYKISIQSN